MEQTLIERLTTADLICSDCGNKYGRYSVGCSTFHQGTCQVCGKTAPVTETRDFGYLQRGINTLKTELALVELDEEELASYEVGGLCLHLTEEEATYLYNCLDLIASSQVDEKDTEVFVSLETKINELYCDYCIEYSLSPVTAAYHKKYGTYGVTSEEAEHFQKFKDNYEMLVELGFITEGDNA